MGYDGSINIDTRMDTKGVNKGTKSISSSLSGVLRSVMTVAKTMAAVFVGGSIINGIRSLMGQFDLMGSSIGASVKSLSTSFDALKGAFANLILTALAPLIPYVITFVQWLTRLFTIVTQIIGALFGVKAGFGGVASSAGGAGKATKKAAKDAAGALAAFDQINVLQQNKDQQPEDTGGGAAGGGLALPAVDPISPETLAKLEEFKAKAAEFFKPLTDALGRLYEALKPLGETIWAGLKWAWDNILVPLGTWAVSDLLPAFLDLLAGAADALNEVLIALAPMAKDFFDNFLKPAAEWTGGKIIEGLNWLTEKLHELAEWIKENPEKFRSFVTTLGILWISIVTFFGAIVAFTSGIAALTGVAIAAIIAFILMVILNWKNLGTTVQQIGVIIGYYMALVGQKIKDSFNTALDAVKSKFESIFTGIQNFVKSAINTIIGYINSMISNIVSGINGVISGLNSVGKVVPGFKAISTVSAPQIPRLATGAVIPPNSEFLAMLGDQRSGTNIETPVNLMREVFREELGQGMNANITINFSGSLSSLVRELKPYIDKETVRVGQNFVSAKVTTG